MKILIAGLGSIGRRHLQNLLALGERDLLLYRTGLGAQLGADLEGIPVETDLAAALAHRPQAVVISNPTALHLEVAIPAAEAGCHLLLEKPVAHSLERVGALQSAVQNGGGRVLVGYQLRFNPGLQQVASLLSSGGIGRLLSARAHWGEWLPGWHPWEDYRQGYSARADLGGGVILTLSHPLDYLRWLLGPVQAVYALAGHLGDLELDVVDTAEISLQFASGALGSVHLDYNQQPPTHTLELVGTRGTLRWDNQDGAVSLFQAQHPDLKHNQTAPGGGLPGEILFRSYAPPPGFQRNDLFLAEMRHFLAVARGEQQPVCTLEDGVQALSLALAAHQSNEEGRLISL